MVPVGHGLGDESTYEPSKHFVPPATVARTSDKACHRGSP